jgi:cobalamin transport system substrate-binding protein
MRRAILCFAILALLASGCGSNSPAPSATATSSFPVVVSASNGPIALPHRPVRIISLSSTATEILFAIGAGPQVTAADDQSNYPPTAPKSTLSGFEPNVEAIASYRPDLVVFADDGKKIGAAMARLGIPALYQPPVKSFDDAYGQMSALGKATGREVEAAALVQQMRKDIDAIVANAPTFTGQLSYYHELDDNYFSATSRTFIGKIYSLFHLRNIADAADKHSTGYPQLSPEYIIQADPDLIFLADTKCCHQTAASVAKRPGWSGLKAVHTGGVVALDDDVASRWGPRMIDFLRTIASALEHLKAGA